MWWSNAHNDDNPVEDPFELLMTTMMIKVRGNKFWLSYDGDLTRDTSHAS